MRTEPFICTIGAILLLQGCSLAPKFTKPKMDLPGNKAVQVQAVNMDWWKNFKDENLNQLIKEALKNNDDLRIAVVRVKKAAAYLRLQSANLYPNISASAAGIRQQTSGEVPLQGAGAIADNFALSSQMSYEIDFWGKLANQKRAAVWSLLATEADKETVRLSLISNIAALYFNIIATNRQLKIAEDTLKSYKKTYEYRKSQYKYGEISKLVVQQAKYQYENAKILTESLKEQRMVQMSAMSVLLGRSPKEIFKNNVMLDKALPSPPRIPYALPSSILENRPDIKAAEENMRAKNALIGAAKAAYFPLISLTGLLGFQSDELGRVIRNSAKIWSIGASMGMPVFDFGRTGSNVKIAKLQKEEAVIRYKKTVRNAFKEVFDALNSLRISKNQLIAQRSAVGALKRALHLSEQRYASGYSSYLEVLDAQKGYLRAKLNLERLKADVLINEVTLYKALGGGWSPDSGKD